jgi:hypothetical protein
VLRVWSSHASSAPLNKGVELGGVHFADKWERDDDRGLLGSAVVDCLHPPQVLLNQLAKKFIQWNGEGDLPTLSADEIGSWTPVSLPPVGKARAAHLEWQNRFRVEYVDKVEALALFP